MKAVVDTNVFASGIFWKGKPELVINAWVEGEFELLTSKPIIDEYTRSLFHLSAGRRDDLVEKWLYQILEFSICVEVHQHFSICRDRTDNKWLDCATAQFSALRGSGSCSPSPRTPPMHTIDQNVCTHCAGCSSVCPGGAIVVTNERSTVTAACIDCGNCAVFCPIGGASPVPQPGLPR